MATEELECPFCFELYDDPVVLSCGHSMCKKCALKTMAIHSVVKPKAPAGGESKEAVPVKAVDVLSRAVCGRCNKETTTEHTTNKTLAEQVAQVRKNVCGHCEEKPVEQDCLNCGFGFCADCKQAIHSKGMFAKHQFAPAGSLKRTAAKTAATKQQLLSSAQCRDHQKPLDLFCKECQMTVCDYCERIGAHKGHSCEAASEAMEDLVMDVKTFAVQLSEAKKELEVLRGAVRDDNQLSVKAALELRTAVEAAFNRLESALGEARTAALQGLQQHIHKTEMESAVRMSGLEALAADANRLALTCTAESKTPQLSKADRLALRSHISTMGQDLNNVQVQLPSTCAHPLGSAGTAKSAVEALTRFAAVGVTRGAVKGMAVPFGPGTSGVIGFTELQVKFLSRHCGAPFTQSRLLYKASRDGYSNSAFHRLCDKQGACVVVVRTATGHVFGAYTSVGWKSIANYATDNKAFLFSLSQGAGVPDFTPQQCALIKNDAHALYDTGSYGPTFGTHEQQHDLHLNLDILQNCHSVLGGCYQCPAGVIPQNFLAGSESFWKLEDVVVYKV